MIQLQMNDFRMANNANITGYTSGLIRPFAIFAVIVLGFSCLAKAQTNAEYVFAHFEDGTAEGFVNGIVVNNPMTIPVNPSQKVLHYTGGAWWGPSLWSNNGHLKEQHLKLLVDVYLPQGGLHDVSWSDDDLAMFILHLRNCASGNVEHFESPASLVFIEQNWVTIEFDVGEVGHFCHRNLIVASSSPVGFYADNYRWLLNTDEEDYLFMEKFEGIVFPPDGWSMYSSLSDEKNWQISSEHNNTHLGRYSSSHPAAGFEQHKNWLITPAIQIPDSEQYELAFASYNSSTDWYNPGDGKRNSVWVSAGSPNPASGDFEQVWEAAEVTQAWKEISIPLNVFAGQEIYIAFVYEGSMVAHAWFLDDIKIVEGEPKAFLSINSVTACAPGFVRVEAILTNPDPAVAFQLDVALPEGFSYSEGSAELPRGENHTVLTANPKENTLWILSYSTVNQTYEGSDGVILAFDLYTMNEPGTYPISFDKALVSSPEGTNILYQSGGATITLTEGNTFIHTHPQSKEAYLGENVSFTVGGIGENLTYQWFFNDLPIQGAHQAELRLVNVSLNDAGTYHCLVAGDCGALYSEVATLTVIDEAIFYQVTFEVSGENNLPIENALIVIKEEYELNTGADGIATTELPNGTYPYEIKVDGYQVFNGVFFVSGGDVVVNVKLQPLSVNDMLAEKVNVYPNPFNHSLMIEGIEWASKLMITSITGQLIAEEQLNKQQQHSLQTGKLHEGMYLLFLYGRNGEQVVIRIIKE